jgi:hypothetical protein
VCYRRTPWCHQDTVTAQVPINMGMLVWKPPIFLACSIKKLTREAMYVRSSNVEARSYAHYCSVKAVSINIFGECVSVALDIHHAARMRHIFVCGLPGSTMLSPHYLINGTIFEEKVLNTTCVFRLSLQLLCEKFLVLRRTERDMIINVRVYWSSCKVPVILVRV